ncbi:MAG: hypothetical protein LC676_10970 [Loktanella sp.]|nr:hypothetical protein [Loktanella sp.]
MQGLPRPLYARQKDDDNERTVASVLERHYGVTAQQTPRRYVVDLLLLHPNGRPHSWVEVKARTIPFRGAPYLIMSLEKVIGLQVMAAATGIASRIAIKLTDGVFIAECPKRPVEFKMSGRRDRGDPEDMEPCVLLRWDDMTRIDQP